MRRGGREAFQAATVEWSVGGGKIQVFAVSTGGHCAGGRLKDGGGRKLRWLVNGRGVRARLEVKSIESCRAASEEREEKDFVRGIQKSVINVTNKVYGWSRLGEQVLEDGIGTSVQRTDSIKQGK